MSTTNTYKGNLDLNLVKDIVFQDIDRLLDSFHLEYSVQQDNIFMKCPVHDGADNPQGCTVSPKYRVWKCWTRDCHEHYGSDIFGFVKGVLGTDDFREVLRYLGKLYSLKDAKGFVPKPKPVETDLSTMLKYFNNRWATNEDQLFDIETIKTLPNSPYFESRGFQPETLRLFGVKDCDDNHSKYKRRAIIPIYFNKVYIGFIARGIHPWVQPKYLFSDGLRKTDYFYNWDRAIEHALMKRTLFIVEGQGDVWKMHEAGVINCVGMFGKAMSDHQRRLLLTSGITNLVILTDNDAAGRESKIKIKRDLGRLFTLIFPKMSTKDIGGLLVEQLQQDILSPLKGLY